MCVQEEPAGVMFEATWGSVYPIAPQPHDMLYLLLKYWEGGFKTYWCSLRLLYPRANPRGLYTPVQTTQCVSDLWAHSSQPTFSSGCAPHQAHEVS